MDEEAPNRAWHEIVLDVLKRHKVSLAPYVPDNVLRPLIEAVHADPFFTAFSCAREEEAVGIVSGAWMGGLRGIVLMQTSGFATLPNAIASLAVPTMADSVADPASNPLAVPTSSLNSHVATNATTTIRTTSTPTSSPHVQVVRSTLAKNCGATEKPSA